MPRYKLTQASATDLDEIWEYTYENWGLRQARHYLQRLKSRIEELSKTPDIGRKRERIAEGLMGFHEGRHVILYRKEKTGIIIIRILHDSMDIPEQIKESET